MIDPKNFRKQFKKTVSKVPAKPDKSELIKKFLKLNDKKQLSQKTAKPKRTRHITRTDAGQRSDETS